MHEDTAQQTPPLPSDGERAVIRSPMPQLRRCWLGERNASQCHGDEHRDVDSENGLRDHHRTGLPPHPWCRFDSLDGRILASLRSFMLHAPLAKLLAKSESWKLAAAFNAICH